MLGEGEEGGGGEKMRSKGKEGGETMLVKKGRGDNGELIRKY